MYLPLKVIPSCTHQTGQSEDYAYPSLDSSRPDLSISTTVSRHEQLCISCYPYTRGQLEAGWMLPECIEITYNLHATTVEEQDGEAGGGTEGRTCMWALTKAWTGLRASCCSFSRARTRATTRSTSCTTLRACAQQPPPALTVTAAHWMTSKMHYSGLLQANAYKNARLIGKYAYTPLKRHAIIKITYAYWKCSTTSNT